MRRRFAPRLRRPDRRRTRGRQRQGDHANGRDPRSAPRHGCPRWTAAAAGTARLPAAQQAARRALHLSRSRGASHDPAISAAKLRPALSRRPPGPRQRGAASDHQRRRAGAGHDAPALWRPKDLRGARRAAAAGRRGATLPRRDHGRWRDAACRLVEGAGQRWRRDVLRSDPQRGPEPAGAAYVRGRRVGGDGAAARGFRHIAAQGHTLRSLPGADPRGT